MEQMRGARGAEFVAISRGKRRKKAGFRQAVVDRPQAPSCLHPSGHLTRARGDRTDLKIIRNTVSKVEVEEYGMRSPQ